MNIVLCTGITKYIAKCSYINLSGIKILRKSLRQYVTVTVQWLDAPSIGYG